MGIRTISPNGSGRKDAFRGAIRAPRRKMRDLGHDQSGLSIPVDKLCSCTCFSTREGEPLDLVEPWAADRGYG